MNRNHVEPEKGKKCPNCGEIYEGQHFYSWDVDEVPHDDPKVCIRSLKERLEEVERKLARHNF